MTSYAVLKTSQLGDLLLVASPSHLTGLYFVGQDEAPMVKTDWQRDPAHPILAKAAEQLGEFLRGQRREFSLPLHYDGTPFQREIWRRIAEIPFGQTITYTDLAAQAGAPRATRAAGSATGKNRIGIIIPCHRVVAAQGALGGYAGGSERKTWLLELEGIRIGKRPLKPAAVAEIA